MKSLIFGLLVLLSANSYSAMRIDSIKLNDDSVITANQIETPHFAPITNEIDYVDLLDGSRVESTEIKTINFKSNLSNKFLKSGIEVQARAVRIGGDGSGG